MACHHRPRHGGAPQAPFLGGGSNYSSPPTSTSNLRLNRLTPIGTPALSAASARGQGQAGGDTEGTNPFGMITNLIFGF